MDPALVDTITELVLQELSRQQPAQPPSQGKQVVLCPGPGPGTEAVWKALKSVEGVAWQGIAWTGFSVGRLQQAMGGVAVSEPPSCWETLVNRCEAVVLPSLDLGGLAALALLLTDRPPAGAAVAALIQDRPVMVVTEGLERFRRHANRLPGGLLEVFESHYQQAEKMGVQFVAAQEVGSALTGGPVQAAQRVASGRDVVTLEDLEQAQRRQEKVLSVQSGAIVTPLARQAAREMGIEVRFQ